MRIGCIYIIEIDLCVLDLLFSNRHWLVLQLHIVQSETVCTVRQSLPSQLLSTGTDQFNESKTSSPAVEAGQGAARIRPKRDTGVSRTLFPRRDTKGVMPEGVAQSCLNECRVLYQ